MNKPGFESLWDRHRGDVMRFIRSRNLSPADIDDLMQDISIKVFNAIPNLKDESSAKSWILQIAHRALIDFKRGESRRRRLAMSLRQPETAGAADDVLEALEPCVHTMLGALPCGTRALIQSVDIDGHAQKEFAQTLDLSYSAVKSRVQRGRTALRARFEACCRIPLTAPGAAVACASQDADCRNC